MSGIEILLIVWLAINSATLIFLLFRCDRMLRQIGRHEEWLKCLDDQTRLAVDHIVIIGEKVFNRRP